MENKRWYESHSWERISHILIISFLFLMAGPVIGFVIILLAILFGFEMDLIPDF